jgi:DNA-binding NarL/FixJ family response regulator
MDRLVVAAWSADPLTAEGVAAMLRVDVNLDTVPIENLARNDVMSNLAGADVVLIAGYVVDARVTELISRTPQRSPARMVLLIDELTYADLRLAETRPVAAILARSTTTGEGLVNAVRAVHADHAMPRLVDQVKRVGSDRLRPRGPSGIQLSAREHEVLRLLAEGCDTTEIAKRMAYSDRTVKNIIHVLLERLGSRNRAHAVAFATREGII